MPHSHDAPDRRLSYTLPLPSGERMNPNVKLRTGGQILVDQLVAQGVGHVFCVPGNPISRCSTRCATPPIALTVCRQETGAGIMAEACGAAVRPPRRRLRHPRSRRDQRRPRDPYRGTVEHAAHSLRRADRAPRERARRVPGDGLFRLLRVDREMGDPDRGSRAHSRNDLPAPFMSPCRGVRGRSSSPCRKTC